MVLCPSGGVVVVCVCVCVCVWLASLIKSSRRDRMRITCLLPESSFPPIYQTRPSCLARPRVRNNSLLFSLLPGSPAEHPAPSRWGEELWSGGSSCTQMEKVFMWVSLYLYLSLFIQMIQTSRTLLENSEAVHERILQTQKAGKTPWQHMWTTNPKNNTIQYILVYHRPEARVQCVWMVSAQQRHRWL